jgi:cytidylate kinase
MAEQPASEVSVMTIVAISREMGSGGYEIAAAVARALEFEYVDRQILLHAAKVHEVPEEKIADVADRHLTLWERFDEEKRRFLIFIEAAYYAFAEKGNLVTAGRGGPFFLRGVKHALRVRITAPVDVRVRRVMERDKLDHRAAAAKVRSYDKEMAARIDYLFGLDWHNPEHYDLILNTSGDAWDFYTDIVVAAARHPRFQSTPESVERVQALSLAAQVRAAIARDPMTKNINVEVAVEAGQVSLKGVVFSPTMMDAAAEVARRVPGVRAVSCEAVEIPRVYPGPIM